MKHYIASKGDFNVHFKFNSEGLLIELRLPEDIAESSQLWLMRNMPICESDLPLFKNKSKMNITEVITQVTFDDFYKLYGYKEGRKKAEAAWNKLPKAEQIKAYRYVPTIKSKKHLSGENLPYPATYLNQQRWND